MAIDENEMADSFAYARETLSVRAPELWDSLNDPAPEADIEALQRRLYPLPIPPALLTYLRLANGQGPSADFWPGLDCGPLLTAQEIISEYDSLFAYVEDWQWSKRWLPLSRAGWYSSAVEMVDYRTAAILDTSFPDLPSLKVPSLPALFKVSAQLAEAGLVPGPPVDYKAKPGEPIPPHVQLTLESHFTATRALLTELYAREGWGSLPFRPWTEIDPSLWIDDWDGPHPIQSC